MGYKYKIEVWKETKSAEEKEMVYESRSHGAGTRTIKSCLQTAHRTLLDWLKAEKDVSQ